MKNFTQAALVADALNLGPHWIYNPAKLARVYPDGIYSFSDPLSQYHPNRKAGLPSFIQVTPPPTTPPVTRPIKVRRWVMSDERSDN